MRLSASFDFARRRQIAARSRTQTLAITRTFRVLGWVVLLAAALLVYLPSLQGELVWEDAAVTRTAVGRHAPAYRDVLSHEQALGAAPERFRPLTQMSFRVDAARGGHPLDFHRTSLALHLINIALLFLCASRLGLSRGAAWFGALLFAVYPLCTTAVGHISGREETLALTFMLLTLALHMSGSWLMEAVAVVCFGLALLARPAAVGVAAVVAAWEMNRSRSVGAVLARIAPYVAVSLIMLMVVDHQLGSLGFMSAREAPVGTLLMTLPVALYRLIQLMLRPFAVTQPSVLSFRAQNLVPWVRGWSEPATVVAMACALGYVAAMWLSHRGRGRAFALLVAVPALWLPLDSLFFGRAFDLTHNLYAPSAAFALLLALVVEKTGFHPRASHLRRGVVGGMAILVALSFGVAARVRVGVWKDETAIYQEALNHNPTNAEYHAAYGTTLARRGDELPAVDELHRSIQLNPNLGVAHYNLGLLQMSLARYGEATVELQRAAALMPADAEAWYHWSEVERRQGDLTAALTGATRAVALQERRPEYHLALAAARLEREDLAEAESEARRAIALDPRSPRAYAMLAAVVRRAGRQEEALTASSHAVQLDSRDPDAVLEQARSLAAAGRDAEALEQLSLYEALEAQPEKSALALKERLRKKVGS